ncbi:MAG: SPASM domain-containing protein [Clostridia bacterium]|nr:SPASM domain-containing protein [Clostridia bacterium]
MHPLTLLIKPAAGLCNLNCRYCFYRPVSADRENLIMTYETVDLLIRKLAAFRPTSLTVMFQGGEPTLAGLEFYRYFVAAFRNNLRVPVSFAMQTNGLLLDDAFAAFFRENRFLLGVSLDGTGETNDRNRVDSDGNGTHDRVMQAVALLRRHRVEFNILSVVDNDSVKALGETFRFFKENGLSYIQFIPCLGTDDHAALTVENYALFLKNTFDLWYSYYIREDYVSVRHIDNYMGIFLGSPPENCAMCGVCGSYFTVEANGDLYPCDFYCDDAHRIGSLSDENPFVINEKHRAFIEESKVIHSHCQGCRYHDICRGGCKADRIDGFAENRYCAAYKEFFAYAAPRMSAIARRIKDA